MHKVGASSHALVLPIYTGRYLVSVFEYLTLKANHNGWGRRADRASKKLLSADKPFKTANYAIFKPCVVTSFKYRALSTTLVKLLLTFVGVFLLNTYAVSCIRIVASVTIFIDNKGDPIWCTRYALTLALSWGYLQNSQSG